METKELTIERMAIDLVKFNELGEVVLNEKQKEAVSDEIVDIRRYNGKFNRSVEVEVGASVELSGWCGSWDTRHPGDGYLVPDCYDVTYEGDLEELYVLIYNEDTNSFKRYDVTMDFYKECYKQLVANY